MATVGIIGASGFTGAELMRIASRHPQLDIAFATGDSQAGSSVASLYPSLAAAYPGMTYASYGPELLDGVDLVFLGLPHGASQAIVPDLVARGLKVVDLAADFRLSDPAAYPVWYGEAHTSPHLLDKFVYGLPELFRKEIVGASLVANPGCYPTASALALAPAAAGGFIETSGIVVDAASGVSGAGRAPKPNTTFNAVDEDYTAYGLLNHRHTPEIEQSIARVAGADPSAVDVIFTPHLAPMNRGILATCYARPTQELTTDALLAHYADFYADEPFVVVSERSPSTKASLGSNTAHITVRSDPRTGWIVAICAIDNLAKGASSQAVQCANIILGLDETTGLDTVGVFPVSVTAAEGFTASGVSAGVKESGDLDLSLVATADGLPVPSAAVFTSNLMTAAPVIVTRGHLKASGGRTSAVILNSGNANAATGQKGTEDAQQMCALTAAELGCDYHNVVVCSTGLIGIPLPIDKISTAIPALVAARSPEGSVDAAEAIRTTDTHRKEVVVRAPGFTVGGMAKGAAMLAPNMATMLAVLTTDAAMSAADLKTSLQTAVSLSFNRMSVDGCTSTNDTVLVLASGTKGPAPLNHFTEALTTACADLAAQMAGDAEGATKVVRLTVVGAHDDQEAEQAARKAAQSLLVKCSWYGEKAYWGRIASELGSAGVGFDQQLVSIAYGGIKVCAGGVEIPHDKDAVAAHMAQHDIEITCDLQLGTGRATILTNDLTHGYIDENMGDS